MDYIEEVLKASVTNLIGEEVDKIIEKKTIEFRNELISKKNIYISEVMKGIGIVHEENPELMCTDYRIIFINKYER